MVKSTDVKHDVESELEFDALIDRSAITVQCLGGDVALTGVVTSCPQVLEAAAAARRVSGVAKVHNHLEVRLPEDHLRDDATLTTAVNEALAMAVTVPAGVEGRAKDGVVTLSGTASSGRRRDAAAESVTALFGVRGIRNHIGVRSDADLGDVAERVRAALDRNALVLADSEVFVDAEDRVVLLAGHVRTSTEHQAVLATAWRSEGVEDVRDDLLVTG